MHILYTITQKAYQVFGVVAKILIGRSRVLNNCAKNLIGIRRSTKDLLVPNNGAKTLISVWYNTKDLLVLSNGAKNLIGVFVMCIKIMQ